MTLFERILWISSIVIVTAAFVLSGSGDWLNLIASIIGVTAVIFVSKGYALGNANLLVSTISVTTSFCAASLTVLRSAAYAIWYAANDGVLIVLWILASLADPSYMPMVVCFSMFFINDLYGFYNWRRMGKMQMER